MIPDLQIGKTPTGELRHDPKLEAALQAAREKIKSRCRVQCEVLKSNLQIMLDDFCREHGITAIAWMGPCDEIAPAFVLDLLAARLTERLAEQEFQKFLTQFADRLIEFSESDSGRSQ